MANEETIEQKVTRLEAEKAEAIKANGVLQTKVEELTKSVSATARDLNKALAENDELQKSKDEMEAESAEMVSTLSAELAKSKVISDEVAPTITVGGVDYRVHGKKFTYQRKEHTLQELLHDSELQKALVNMKAGFLVAVD